MSIGLLTTMITASGEVATICLTLLAVISAFTLIKSSRLIPGLRGAPEVSMTTLDPCVSL